VAALGIVLGLDAIAAAGHWSLLVRGLLDEPAHLLTAWLLLAAILPARLNGVRAWALVGAVAIDVDHVPLYLWGVGAGPGGRPVTHSLLAVAALVAVALIWKRARGPLGGLALGLLLHLVRDSATGPGVPLLGPLEDGRLLVPYVVYACVIVVATTGAVLRLRRTAGR
jgi:inner membrane protein